MRSEKNERLEVVEFQSRDGSWAWSYCLYPALSIWSLSSGRFAYLNLWWEAIIVWVETFLALADQVKYMKGKPHRVPTRSTSSPAVETETGTVYLRL